MASAQLTRTTGTPTSTDIGTISFWMKRSVLDENNNYIISNYISGNSGYIRFKSDNQLQAYSSVANDEKRTNRLFRDVNGWYHIVLRVDTSQSTASDRVRMYINGVQETSFSTGTNCSQNADYDLFKASGSMRIGYIQSGTATYFSGQLAHFHYADGQSYAPTVFGQTDATTGIWKPITSPSVTYGNNGFFLKFDNSANMGLDSSGNSNNFTTSGTIIQNKDTPSNVFATMDINTKNANASVTLTNVGSTVNVSNGADNCTSSLMVSSGKYYWEGKQTVGSLGMVGIRPEGMHYNQSSIFNLTGTYQGYYYYGDSGNIRPANTSYGATFGVGDIIGFALDLDNNKLYFSKNGTWQNSGDPTSGSTGTGAVSIATSGLTWGFSFTSGGGSDTFQMNFGNGYFGTTAVTSAQNPDDGVGIFEYDVPAGYRALCTKSINAQEYS